MPGNHADVPQELDAIADLLTEAGRRLKALSAAWPSLAPAPAGTGAPPVPPAAESLPLAHLEDQLVQATRAFREREASWDAAQHYCDVSHARREDAQEQLAALERELDAADMDGEGMRDSSGLSPEQMRQQARQEVDRAVAEAAMAGVRSEHARVVLAEAGSVVATLTSKVQAARAQPPPSTPLAEVSLRLVVLTALNELRAPIPAGVLSSYIEARFGREVRSDRWGALRRDEQRSFSSYERRGKTRDAWLCPALDADTGRSIPNLWTVSDWPWSLRLVVEDSSVLSLRLLHRLLSRAINPPPDTQDARKLIDLGMREVAELGRSFDGPTPLATLTAARDWVSQQLAQPGSGTAHDPDDDHPPEPPWLDDAPLSDRTDGRLFGVEVTEVPF